MGKKRDAVRVNICNKTARRYFSNVYLKWNEGFLMSHEINKQPMEGSKELAIRTFLEFQWFGCKFLKVFVKRKSLGEKSKFY